MTRRAKLTLENIRGSRSNDECWPWLGKLDNRGRPMTSGGRARPNVRFYETTIGQVPKGMVLKRTCADKACVNPHHMRPMIWDRGIVRAKLEGRVPRLEKIVAVADGVARIPLGGGLETLVDEIDLPLVAAWNWHARVRPTVTYVVRQSTAAERLLGASKNIYMHRVILGTPDDMQTDHANGNGLDNRRCNIRVCDHAQNQQNRGVKAGKLIPFKGVRESGGRYWATVTSRGEKWNLGPFDTVEEAAMARDAKALEVHGEFFRPSIGLTPLSPART